VRVEGRSTAVEMLGARVVLSILRDVSRRQPGAAALRERTADDARRLAILADVSALFASVPDPDDRLRQLADLLVPALADGCVVDAIRPDGGLREIHLACRDPQLLAIASEIRGHYADDASDPLRTGGVLRSGLPTLVAQATDDLLRRYFHRGDDFARMKKFRLRSLMFVPLVASGQTLGLLTLLTTGQRRLDDADLGTATQLAGRAARAIEDARHIAELRAANEQLRHLSSEMRSLQEAERRFIARELHDQVGSLLTGLKLNLEIARLDGNLGALDDASALVDEMVARVRALALELRPPMLDDFGLVPALQWLRDHWTGRTGVKMALRCGRLKRRFDPATETAAFRIVQEALTNAAKHSGAREVRVEVTMDQVALTIEVADTGQGFDTVAAQSRSTVGLAGMRDRAESLGGRLEVASQPGGGTRVRAILPHGPGTRPSR
jgi:signal transduction histidine kinase